MIRPKQPLDNTIGLVFCEILMDKQINPTTLYNLSLICLIFQTNFVIYERCLTVCHNNSYKINKFGFLILLKTASLQITPSKSKEFEMVTVDQRG